MRHLDRGKLLLSGRQNVLVISSIAIADNLNNTEVIVNTAPGQGSVYKTLPTANGHTIINISVNQHMVQAGGSSSTHLNINSSTSLHTKRVDYDEHSPPL